MTRLVIVMMEKYYFHPQPQDFFTLWGLYRVYVTHPVPNEASSDSPVYGIKFLSLYSFKSSGCLLKFLIVPLCYSVLMASL